jgi:hypothetical protein
LAQESLDSELRLKRYGVGIFFGISFQILGA